MTVNNNQTNLQYQVQMLVDDASASGELEETVIEELRQQLMKPTLMFGFRNVNGEIDQGLEFNF